MLNIKILRSISVIVLITVLLYPDSSAQSGAGKARSGNFGTVLKGLKRSVVFLGRIQQDGKPSIFATGFLVYIGEAYHLVTAKHVIIDPVTLQPRDEGLLAFFNLRGGGVSIRSISDIKKEFGLEWITHPDPAVDIAVIPFLVNTNEDDVQVIPDSLFTYTEHLAELYDVFFMSYQPGIEPKGKISPIVRSGTISLIKDDNTFYIDASSFPGNSGSPVFLKPWSSDLYERMKTGAGTDIGGGFVGIIGEYIPYKELAVSAQTGRPRIIFEENTGLSRVWSVSYINDITKLDTFKKQVERIKGR